jgi:hypothetical protein
MGNTTMAADTIDYVAVLADLEARKTAIDAAIAGVRQMLGLGSDQAVTSSMSARKERATEVRVDSFFGMTMPDAIVKFLEITKQPQSVSDITVALLDGGFKTTAKNLMPSVGSTLSRMKTAGDLVSVQGKWGLVSWYPGMRKEKLESPSKILSLKQPTKKETTGADMVQPTLFGGSQSTRGRRKLTPEQVEQIKIQRAAGKTLDEIAKEFGVAKGTVWMNTKTWKAEVDAKKKQAAQAQHSTEAPEPPSTNDAVG